MTEREPKANADETWAPTLHPTPVPHAVLLVDDDPRIRAALKRALRNEPYDVLIADSGPQALDMLAETDVQVVISDLGMPGMDGIALLAEVAERSSDIVRLVLSGRSDSQMILDAINSGSIYRYVLKPWNDDQLKIVIRQALALWDLQADRRYLLETLKTQNRELETLVAQRTQQMLAVERQADIGRYASQIVHNLSNPLYAVSAALELLGTYVENDLLVKEKLEKGINIARSATDDLRQIIAGILSRAREDERFSMTVLEINPLIEKELAFFDMVPDFKYKVEKVLHLDPAAPRIRGNPIQIKQILDNLIKNALDAMEDAAVKRLTLETASEDGHVLIRISDTGQGIAPADMDRIFSPDFTTKPIGKGTGLGLASVRTMVDAYSGTIQVRSTVGRQTTFEIRFPSLPKKSQQTQNNNGKQS